MLLFVLSGSMTGCAPAERRSLPHLEGPDWRVVDKVHIEGPGISMAFMPDNGEWRKSLGNKELFVRAGFLAAGNDRLWFDPTKVLLDYRGQIYKPTVFLCNRETDRQFRPNPRIVSTELIDVSREIACVFLKYDILPPDTKEEFVLHVEGLTRKNSGVKVPPIRFKEGTLVGHTLGR
jgi:hypothetical protein